MHLFIDTETTGFACGGIQPRIVSIAWVVAAAPERPHAAKAAIVRPDGFVIPRAAQAVHGISTARAQREGRPLGDVLAELHADVAAHRPASVVAHNLAFDRPIVDAEFTRLGQRSPLCDLLGACTMRAARARWPGHSAKLADVHRRLFAADLQNAHSAAADVWACHRIFFALS